MSGSAAKFLNTTGNTTLGIGVCARCNTKRALVDLTSDPNAPGLKVCRDAGEGCLDKYDPYRLPPRQPDKVTLPFARPDQPMELPRIPYEPTTPGDALPAAEPYEFLRDG